jgi:hypothetical protein
VDDVGDDVIATTMIHDCDTPNHGVLLQTCYHGLEMWAKYVADQTMTQMEELFSQFCFPDLFQFRLMAPKYYAYTNNRIQVYIINRDTLMYLPLCTSCIAF